MWGYDFTGDYDDDDNANSQPGPLTLERAGVGNPGGFTLFTITPSDSPFSAGAKAFVNSFATGLADIITDEVPYIAQAKAADKIINDRNLVTGEDDLSAFDRGASAVDLIPGGSTIKKAAEGLGALYGLIRGGNKARRSLDGGLDAGLGSLRHTPPDTPDLSRVDEGLEAAPAAKPIVAGVDAPRGACFVAGTPVVQHADERRLTDTQIVQAEVEPSDDSSSLLLAASASVIAIAGLSLPKRRSRKQQSADSPRNNPTNRDSEGDRMMGGESSPKTEGASPAVDNPATPLGPPTNNPTRRGSNFLRTAWLACWLSVAGFLAFSGLGGSQPSLPAIKTVPVASVAADPTIAIEEICVGDRVAGSYSAGELAGETKVEPATWRKLRLRSEHRWEDGTLDVMNVTTLQPPEWLAEHRPEVGAAVPLPLDLLEMGLPEGLEATVIANEPCPAIKEGPGRVVLTTVDHLNDNVYELAFATPAGESESVQTTGLHKFYRPADDAWVSAQDLAEGDRLEGPGGPLVVQSLAKVPGTHRVYNMTVETEHVYRVSTLGALVHNNGCAETRPPNLSPPGAGRRGAFREAKRQSGIPVSQQPDRVLPNLDRRGNVQPGKRYEFDIKDANGGVIDTKVIRDDAGGHFFGLGDLQNRGPHFNDPSGGHFDY